MNVIVLDNQFFTIWRHDEDDRPQLTPGQRRALEVLSGRGALRPAFIDREISDYASQEAIMRAAVINVARELGIRTSWAQACMWASKFLQMHGTKPGCFQRMYKDGPLEFYLFVADRINYERQRWWQHPRWRIWRWRGRLHNPFRRLDADAIVKGLEETLAQK